MNKDKGRHLVVYNSIMLTINNNVHLLHTTSKGVVYMDKKQKKHVPNVSGSFQIVSEDQQKDVNNLHEQNLDDEQLYYARLFMED